MHFLCQVNKTCFKGHNNDTYLTISAWYCNNFIMLWNVQSHDSVHWEVNCLSLVPSCVQKNIKNNSFKTLFSFIFLCIVTVFCAILLLVFSRFKFLFIHLSIYIKHFDFICFFGEIDSIFIMFTPLLTITYVHTSGKKEKISRIYSHSISLLLITTQQHYINERKYASRYFSITALREDKIHCPILKII